MVNYVPAALIIFSVFVSVFFGILINRRDVMALKDDVNRRFDQVDRRIDQVDRRIDKVEHRLELIEADQKQFFAVTAKMEGRIDELSRR